MVAAPLWKRVAHRAREGGAHAFAFSRDNARRASSNAVSITSREVLSRPTLCSPLAAFRCCCVGVVAAIHCGLALPSGLLSAEMLSCRCQQHGLSPRHWGTSCATRVRGASAACFCCSCALVASLPPLPVSETTSCSGSPSARGRTRRRAWGRHVVGTRRNSAQPVAVLRQWVVALLQAHLGERRRLSQRCIHCCWPADSSDHVDII